MYKYHVTVITPTTGKNGLNKLIDSINRQSVPICHILLWDNKREEEYFYPNPESLKVKNPYDLNVKNDKINRYSIVLKDYLVQGMACGSSLRAIGLMAANTEYVTFADDDVWFEDNHIRNFIDEISDKNWAYCRRKIWSDSGFYIGLDNFESVGDSMDRKVPYEMADNNCMFFKRRFGVSAACLYRETQEYNDDRLMYDFLKKYAGTPSKITKHTVNQVCPKRLESMFRENCD